MWLRRAFVVVVAAAIVVPAAPAAASATDLFRPFETIRTGSDPENVAIGDVTGDGRADVLLSTSEYSDPANDDKLFVFPQRADGSLGSAVRYPTRMTYFDHSAGGIALLDANGDGRRDVALATLAGVEIFHQTATGTLENRGVLPGTAPANTIVAADADSDGDDDLVVGRREEGATGIVQLTQQADATFSVSVVTTEPTAEVEVGDVDGDGRLDIVGFWARELYVYHRTDDGWRRTSHTPAGGYSRWVNGIEVADVSGDGRADVIATVGGNFPSSVVNVFVQTDAGALASAAVYQTPDIPDPVEAADIDGDGRTDVVTAHAGWYQMSTLLQLPDGTLDWPLTSALPYASDYEAQGLATGDINGDGRTDIVIADYNHGLVVLRNAGTAT